MEIIKKLVLNKTPKDAPNGGIACAMNMMVDDTGSFLSNDIGLSKRFWCTNDNERIVGVIPTNKEIVIFTHDGTNSRIYRLEDGQATRPVEGIDGGNSLYERHTSWKWEGGKITGSYTYNYKGELIIAIGETTTANKKIPLKSFNLSIATDRDDKTYAIEETVPQYDSYYRIKNDGELVCGVYTFFVRFAVDKDNYTKWFQITTDINIIQEVESRQYNHRYLYKEDEHQTLLQHVTAEKFNVNSDGMSNKLIQIGLNFSKYVKTKVQLAFIIKRKSDIQGRIQGTYNIAGENIEFDIVNNNFIDEVSINELIESPHQFYNVEHVVNYNNRLYIAGYNEYENKDYSNAFTNKVSLLDGTGVYQQGHHATSTDRLWDVEIKCNSISNNSTITRTITISNIRTDSNGVVENVNEFLNKLTSYIYLQFVEVANEIPFTSNSGFSYKGNIVHFNNYLFIQNNNVNTSTPICIAKHVTSTGVVFENNAIIDPPPAWKDNWNFDIGTLQVQISDNSIIISKNGEEYNLLDNDIRVSCLNLGWSKTVWDTPVLYYHFGNGSQVTEEENYTPRSPGLHQDFLFDKVRISSRNYNSNADDDSNDSAAVSTNINANTRTLYPYQYYNFFVHFIREDGSATNGFKLGEPTAYKTVLENSSATNIIIPTFNISNPDATQFVGYFITYEEIESTSECIYIIGNVTVNDVNISKLTNAAYMYDLDTIRGNKLKLESNGEYDLNDYDKIYVDNRLYENHIKIKGVLLTGDTIGFLIKNIPNIYKNEHKTLYRLTKNIYTFGNVRWDKDYLPAFLNKQVLFSYTDLVFTNNSEGILVDPNIDRVFTMSDAVSDNVGKDTKYTVSIHLPLMYSIYPTNAMNIKQDFDVAAVVMTETTYNESAPESMQSKSITKSHVNILLTPSKLHDFLELQACYRAHPSKVYVNYREDNISRFDKTVYRSDVISDESLENRFRHFGVDQYKNILENKGKITNLVGIGFYFIVHTEYSMFVFDRSPKMTQKVQLDIPDTFDIDYQEVMPSNEGFGGLKDKNESIVSKHGYIWYDRTNSVIFTFINGQAGQLSADITNYLKYRNVETVRFAEDIKHNRLIICCKTTDNKYFTLSYSFVTNSFISLHNYKFTNNFRTYSTSYIFDENKDNKTLYTFDDSLISKYDNLTLGDDEGLKLFDYYVLREDENKNKDIASYVDIIFNEAYEVPKVLNAINYVLSTFDSNEIDYLPSIRDEKPLRLYSGDIIRIYTDEADTMNMNVSIENKDINDTRVTNVIYGLKPYTLPAWNKGRWVLNYFRNVRVKDETGKDVIYSAADDKTLVYGKYFIIRFVFNNDKKVKLDNVDINTQIY